VKTKLLRFLLVSVAMIIVGFLVFTLFDLFDGSARENVPENLRISAIVGVMTAAFMVFFTKFFPDPRN